MKYVLSIYLPGLVFGLAALIWSVVNGYGPFVVLAWVLISGLGVAVGMHRVYSHKTHELKPWLDTIILFLASLAGQGSTITWVAVHRGYHHRHADQERDLHSPSKGVWHALFGWYTKIDESTINHKYAVDLLRKPNHVRVHKHYIKYMWMFWLALSFVSWKLLAVYFAALFLSLVQDNLVNTLCHIRKLGYRNFDTKDNSINFWPLGYFGWGQGWHNSHHERPAEFKFGTKWWEIDPCVLFLPLLKLGSSK